jgi:hypothetical protein
VCCALQEVWQLLQEFQALISSYIMKYNPPDAQVCGPQALHMCRCSCQQLLQTR